MSRDKGIDFQLSRIGMTLILAYCFLSSIFYSYFAQMHVRINFLPFPIFIGEILLFICVLLFLGLYPGNRFFSPRVGLWLALYFGWVLVKAAVNYVQDGPLTCRNAALFYYPAFAVLAYCFWQKAGIPRKFLGLLSFLAAGILLFKIMEVWYWWTYILLFVIALLNVRSNIWRWLGAIFLAIIIGLGKEYLYNGPRAHFVSILGAVVFLLFYFGALLFKQRRYGLLGILTGVFVLFFIGFFVFSKKSDVHSLTSLKGMIQTYQSFEIKYEAEQKGFVPEKLTIHLYNPKQFEGVGLLVPAAGPSTKVSRTKATASVPTTSQRNYPKIIRELKCSRIREGRPLDLNENNIVFRLFVWRDMIHEVIHTPQAWLTGFSFGHPQRSRSLEVLGWAESEWGRDGWITPHNSFLHIIYRAGLLGVGMIAVLFWMIGRLVRGFYRMNSVQGGLLLAALVYWMVLSNFFVILEFPYNAIVIWTLFGITWAYYHQLKEGRFSNKD